MISSPAEGITAGAVLGASVFVMGAVTADLAIGAVATGWSFPEAM